jgi:hypothetical protein
MPIDPKFLKAEELGIRLEVVSGLPIREAHPVWKHQKAIDRIRSTIAEKPARFAAVFRPVASTCSSPMAHSSALTSPSSAANRTKLKTRSC